MHGVILAAFILVFMLVEAPSLALGPAWVFAATAVYLLGAAALAAATTRISLRGLSRSASPLPATIRVHNVLFLLTQGWLVVGLAAIILLGYGRWVWQDISLGGLPLVGKATVLGPFIAALMLTWLLDYPFYRAVRRHIAQQQAQAGILVRPGWRLGEYLAYNVRHHLLFVAVPIGLIALAIDVLQLYVHPRLPEAIADYLITGGTVAAAAAVFVTAPLLIARIWKTAPLEPGPLRQRLEEICRRLKLRYRDILLWRSGGMIANAGVMGVAGRFRYVLLSDVLIEHMEQQHIESIFAHEAGHIVSRHIPYSVLFAVATVAICGMAGDFLAARLNAPYWAGQMLAVAMLAAAWAGGFGWLSRRFERQSDVIAAWALAGQAPQGGEDKRITPEGAATFAQALQRVAQLNGIPARQHNWRHGSISRRISYVLWLGSKGGTRQEIDRTVRGIKIGLWIALAAAGAIAAVQIVLSLG